MTARDRALTFTCPKCKHEERVDALDLGEAAARDVATDAQMARRVRIISEVLAKKFSPAAVQRVAVRKVGETLRDDKVATQLGKFVMRVLCALDDELADIVKELEK